VTPPVRERLSGLGVYGERGGIVATVPGGKANHIVVEGLLIGDEVTISIGVWA
jgi:hypothetical protein